MFELPKLSYIKKLRINVGLSQNKLAKLTNLSQSMIAKVERGNKTPSYESAKKIFDTLKIFIDKNKNNKLMTAGDIKTKNFVYAKLEDSIEVVIKKMNGKFNKLPVLNEGKCVGTITSKSIVMILRDIDFKKRIVKELMDIAPPIISENELLDKLRKILEIFEYVMTSKNGKITGMITLSHFVKHYSKI